MNVSQLNCLGWKVEFYHNKEKIYDVVGKLISTSDQSKANILFMNSNIKLCIITRSEARNEDVWLWNKRLYPAKFDNLIKISKKQRVRGLLKLNELDKVMCKECQIKKLLKQYLFI